MTITRLHKLVEVRETDDIDLAWQEQQALTGTNFIGNVKGLRDQTEMERELRIDSDTSIMNDHYLNNSLGNGRIKQVFGLIQKWLKQLVVAKMICGKCTITADIVEENLMGSHGPSNFSKIW